MTAISKGAGPEDLANLLKRMGPQIAKALPNHVKPERMVRLCLTALRQTPKLAQCSTDSFLGSVMTASQLGLEPNTPLGHCYLIPRKKKGGGLECTFQLGYQGMLELARRSGHVADIYAHVVREGDVFDYRLGLRRSLEHVPLGDLSSKIIAVYAVAHLKDGEPTFVVLRRDEIEARRARSESAGSAYSPWKTDYEAMALKTAIRALWKWMPKSSAMAEAHAADQDDLAIDVESVRLGPGEVVDEHGEVLDVSTSQLAGGAST